LNSVKTKKDLQEIINNVERFKQHKNYIKNELNFISDTDVDKYLNNIIISNAYRPQKL